MRVPARASAAARFPSPPDPPEGGPAVSRHTRLTPIHASTVVSHHILPSVWAGSPKCPPGTGLPPEAAPCSRRRDSRRAGDPFRSMARRAPGGPPVGLGCDASMRARLPWRGGARRCKACMRGLQHGSAAGLGANRPEPKGAPRFTMDPRPDQRVSFLHGPRARPCRTCAPWPFAVEAGVGSDHAYSLCSAGNHTIHHIAARS